jgi:hypothetical protein
VKSRRARRPYVSIVYTAGQANKKLIAPNPHEARSACVALAPASTKMVVL